MKAPRAPGLDARRASEFSAELRQRARAWLPSWGLADGERDFGRALLEIAARFNSEVAERLDRAGEKMRRGFLDWLAVRGQAARPARMPVVFKLTATATEGVLAAAPVRMQVDAGGASVIFETEKDVRLVPGSLAIVAAVDADTDAVYLPPPGLSDLEPLEPLPVQWQLKSFAAAGAITLQVDPETGLAPEMILEAAGQQYRAVKVDKEIVTIDPPLEGELPAGTILRKVTAFAPFDGKTRNRQEHALYLGHTELLDIESAATIAVAGAQSLRQRVTWEYWGKPEGVEEPGWHPLTLAEEQKDSAAVALTKRKAVIEPRDIDGRKSRWIRGITEKVESTQQPFQPPELALRINAADCSNVDAYPSHTDTPSVAGEGMANTTPLVLDNVFFPLGREPRQFDAFYLGSKEAFSKAGAEVQLHFDIADPSFESLAVLHTGPFANNLLAGVAGDGHLYLLSFNGASGELSRGDRRPVRPPSPQAGGTKIEAPPLPLDPQPPSRAALWVFGTELRIAVVASDQTVWMWRHIDSAPTTSGWKPLGAVTTIEDLARITALVYLVDGPGGLLFALRGGKLYVCDPNVESPSWETVETKDGNNTVSFETIAGIGVQAPAGDVDPATRNEGLAGIDSSGSLYAIQIKTVNLKIDGACTLLLTGVRKDIAPAAVRRNDQQLVAVAVDDADLKLRAFLSKPSSLKQALVENGPVSGTDVVGHSVDVNRLFGAITFAVSLEGGTQTSALALWTPFAAQALPPSITFIPSGAGFAGGAPTLLPAHVVVPAVASRVLVAPLHAGQVQTLTAPIGTGVISSTAADQLLINDVVAIPIDATDHVALPVTASHTRGGDTLYPFNTASVEGTLYIARSGTKTYIGDVDPVTPDILQLENIDGDTGPNTKFLLITANSTRVYKVVSFDPGAKTVEVDPPVDISLNQNNMVQVQYHIVVPTGAGHKPLLLLTPASSNWSVALLDRTLLLFPGAEPERQRGTAFKIDQNGHPELVSLEKHWTVLPANQVFVVDGTVGEFKPQLGDPTSNPALSWEYANGTGWWRLDLKLDGTLNLKRSGKVRFTVPDDLRPMDWAGRTNFWIRARLVGGDYGREIVTVRTTGTPSDQQQTIERSTTGIAPPSVVKLHIAYRLCKSVRPTFVLAQDSGSIRDQSDANNTRGATVEAFVPLAFSLGRLANLATTSRTVTTNDDPCHCPGEQATTPATPASTADAPLATASRLASGRALFVGLTAAPSGAPVNVLLLVEKEAPHDQFAPMKIEALAADRFVPIVADDTTRALGESGLLSMAFAVEPTPRELFGQENLTWLRLSPGGGESSGWKPALRGAYLNAVFASAAETLTRELLGSSDGASNLAVRVARPPVLRDSLELRVKEPLGDEEREQLREHDQKRVLSAVEGLPGDWVLWQRVDDPGDESPDARVYALDEASGEIRFGDGQHGMIPPIGRDSIVAFTYRRTEIGGSEAVDVPANSITARTALNLVSPIESVGAVVAADRAAGGALPEKPERVVRFGTARLRHRSRAVTAGDFEDLALESSPDVVQVRCFAGSGSVRLIVVMRGEDPLPDAAEVRELRRLLLDAAPASLGAPDALRITGPKIRRLRVLLNLRVASLDHAGAVSTEVQKRITAHFHTATGGVEKEGWALGAEPSEEEIALSLLDTPRLEGLANVELREVLAGDVERPWKDAVKRDELVMLDKDAVRLQFETVEVIA